MCKKNIGAPNVLQIHVHEKLALSPGSCTVKDTERRTKKRKLNLDQISAKEFKKRTVELKEKSSSATTSSEIREGVTYESAVLSQTGSIPNDKLETIPPLQNNFTKFHCVLMNTVETTLILRQLV